MNVWIFYELIDLIDFLGLLLRKESCFPIYWILLRLSISIYNYLKCSTSRAFISTESFHQTPQSVLVGGW